MQLSNTDWICAQWCKCDTGKSLEYTNVSNGIILFSDVIFFNHFLILRCLLSYCPTFSFASLVVVSASFTGCKNCWSFYQLKSGFGRSFERLMRMANIVEDVAKRSGMRKAENVRPFNRLKIFSELIRCCICLLLFVFNLTLTVTQFVYASSIHTHTHANKSLFMCGYIFLDFPWLICCTVFIPFLFFIYLAWDSSRLKSKRRIVGRTAIISPVK